MIWDIVYTLRAEKEVVKMRASPFYKKLKEIVSIIQSNPYATPPAFEKLDAFENVYSRRINIKHRLVYQVLKDEMIVKIISLWGHYDDN
ncbi:Txe/YoeB family addiction module toxin [Alphaproteobacteria bacterium]|nr:Txe/YoeB family addiction module toxin [Alphaproteobacteria bacterium]